MRTLTLLACLGLGLAGRAQDWPFQPQSLLAGPLANAGPEPVIHAVGVLSATNVARVRVIAGTAGLGASAVRFTSIHDGQSQTLDAAGLERWQRRSAMFNGGTIRVDLVLAPGETGASVSLAGLLVDPSAPLQEDGWAPSRKKSLCGGDNRVASTDNRVGRIGGNCTAWLVSNGAVLTAGHCGVAAGTIFEVNIPASQANGNTVAAAVADQFPVTAGTIVTVNNGVGDDWTVCRLGLNSLGQRAHDIHGFFRMTRELPGGGTTMRVTGCGIDNSPQGSQPGVCGNRDSAGNCTHFGLNSQNQTLQTSTGSFTGESGSGARISLQYAVDTEPANSGSPVIWEANGFTVGIHTAGGCSAGGGANNGTSFELDALENAIAASPAPNARYLDSVKVPGGAENGTVFQPHDTFNEAVNAVPAGGTVSMVRGNYPGTANRGLYTKRMTLIAPVGLVRLGQ